ATGGSGNFINALDGTFTSTTTTSTWPGNGTGYRFDILTPCTGTPSLGQPNAFQFNVCPGNTANISFNGSSTLTSGINYQWQKSANGSNGWQSVGAGVGANSAAYTSAPYSGVDSFYRLVATCTNSNETSISAVIRLTSPSAPGVQTTNIVATSINATSITISATAGNGNNRVIYVSDNNFFIDPTTPNSPGAASTVWQNNGQQLVYDGNAANVTVTNLTPGATYYFRAYEVQKCTAILPNTYYYNTVLGTGNPASASTLSPLNYQVARTTGVNFNSIQNTGNNFTWVTNNGDDNLSTTTSIGFNFIYQGQTVTSFKASTNGFISLAPATTTDNAYMNNIGSNTINRQAIVAPFWDDLVVPGGVFANINYVKYQVAGSAPNRVLTVEWAGMELFNNPGPDLNFQVKLYETTNRIEFVYGNMTGFDGSRNTLYTYSVGMNSFSTAAVLGAGEVFALQAFNTNLFSSANANLNNSSANTLRQVPFCFTRLLFTPGTYGGGTTLPGITNDEPSNALPLSVLNFIPTDFCELYTTNGATASANIATCNAAIAGTPDDDVWFKFSLAQAKNLNITLRSSGAFDGVLQVFSDAGTTPIVCVNATLDGLSENITNQQFAAGNYYIRVYHAGVGSFNTNGTGYFYLGVYETQPPPANDDICGAIDLAVNTACTPVTGSTLAATQSTTAICAGFPDDDVWYSFICNTPNDIIRVQGLPGFNPQIQVFSSSDNTCNGTLTSIACVNFTGTAGLETFAPNNLVPGNTYFIRVYHAPSGAGDGEFTICALATPPVCPTNFFPQSNTFQNVNGITLQWSAATGAQGYDVYLGTSNPPADLVATDVTATSYNTGTLLNGVTYYWYVVAKNNAGFSPTCTINNFSTAHIWSGVVSTDWNNAANWQSATVPNNLSDNVVIPNTVTKPDIASANTFAVKDMILQAGATLTVNGTLQVAGNVSVGVTNSSINATNGTIEFRGTAAQVINPAVFNTPTIANVTINNAAGVALNGALNLTGNLRIIAGTFNTNNNLTLRSTATATARINQITSGGITGSVTVERFLPAKAVRKSIFLASPVTQRINQGWQQQIHITGAVGTCPNTDPSTGFDATITGNPSMFTYNDANATGSKWVRIANTLNTNLTPGTGYRVLVRGPRSVGCSLLDGSATAPTAVTLSATGSVVVGNVAATIRGNGFTFVGNPYASEINWMATNWVTARNTNNISASYWTYDPANANGVYSVYNAGTLTNNTAGISNVGIIASGQSFFVRKTTANNAVLSNFFREEYKSTTAQTGLFRNPNWDGFVRIALRANDNTHLDEAVLRFTNDAVASNTQETDLDALSISEASNTIALVKGNEAYSIQTRTALQASDSVLLQVKASATGNYQLQFSEVDFGANEAWLRDAYTQSLIRITDNSTYYFTVNVNEPATQAANRFMLLFRSSATLPTNFTAIYARAKQDNKAADVIWTVGSDKQVVSYTVERSTDGRNYKAVGSVASQQSNQAVSYSYTDNQAITTVVYYRVQAIAADGSYKYSAVAKLNGKASSIELSLYPNPVQSQLSVQLSQPVKGQLAARVVDSKGQVVYRQSGINLAGSNLLQLSVAHLPQGTYQLTLTNGSDFTATGSFVK
ncbi:MAG: T9SS type A sorting domain-containing protein, partial [Chitinophagaceae bacterium]